MVTKKKDELLVNYKSSLPLNSRPQYIVRAKAFLTWLGSEQINSENIRRWLDKMRRDGYADGSIAYDFGIIRRLCKINDIPWPFHRGDTPVIRESEVFAPALDHEDIKAMVDVVLGREAPQSETQPNEAHRAFLALATTWGLRRGEMQELTPTSLDEGRGLIYIQTLKHGRQRYHLVPPEIMPHLVAWGFEQSLSSFTLSSIFTELKEMIGFTGPDSVEVGWHSIRRALSRGLFVAEIPENFITDFMRWKRSMTNMAMRYGTSRIVGRKARGVELGGEDRSTDELVLAKHPFLPWWRV